MIFTLTISRKNNVLKVFTYLSKPPKTFTDIYYVHVHSINIISCMACVEMFSNEWDVKNLFENNARWKMNIFWMKSRSTGLLITIAHHIRESRFLWVQFSVLCSFNIWMFKLIHDKREHEVGLKLYGLSWARMIHESWIWMFKEFLRGELLLDAEYFSTKI